MIHIESVSDQTLAVRPLAMPNGAVMNLRSVILKPI
jgi:hypothetical protein